MTAEKASTRWARGQSGNPAGAKPGRGTIGALRKQMSAQLGEVMSKLLEQALAGDVKSARLLIERVVPPMRAEAAPIKLPKLDPAGTPGEQGQTILAAVAAGQISPDAAASLLTGLGAIARLREMDELEKRVEALEKGTHS
jgi:hypothetical protein